MRPPQIFPSIPATLPIEAIYRRLGYKHGATRIPADQSAAIRRSLDDARELVTLKGTAVILPIRTDAAAVIEIEGEHSFESAALVKLLDGCGEMLLMAATAGTAIMEAIAADIAGNDITRGVVLDAAASEIVDAALDWIMGYFNRGLIRQGRTLTTRRFSAGYGDFALANQAVIYDLLKLDRIGVSITDSCILVPEKSVSAVAGIRGGGA